MRADDSGPDHLPPRAPLVWMDVTTSARAGHRQSNGTLRVERSYAAALGPLLGPRLAFCRFDPLRGRVSAVAAPPEWDATSAPGGGLGVAKREGIGRRLERAVRRSSRRLLAKAHQALAPSAGARLLPQARAGDVLFLAGETWGERHSLDAVRTLRARGLIVAALCQDFIPIKFPHFFDSDAFLDRYRRYADFLVRDTDLLLAISQSTRADILDHAHARGGPSGRIEVIELGADIPERLQPSQPRDLPLAAARRFVLSVSTIQSRKNFDLLYRLWDRFAEEGNADIPALVIVGQPGFGSNDLLFQIARNPRLRGRVVVLHAASDTELAWLYRNCLWTLYPSFYEGWGLPVAESLAHGKPCISSNTSSLPESAQGLAQLLDPIDTMAWHRAICAFSTDPELIARTQDRIRAHYRRKTWAESAADVSAHLLTLLEQRR